jgi:hypothetical protein
MQRERALIPSIKFLGCFSLIKELRKEDLCKRSPKTF